MRSISKKLLVLIFAFVFGVNMVNVNAFATGNNRSLKRVNNENIRSLLTTNALEWANLIKPEVNITIGNINQVSVPETNQIKYVASFFSDTIPYGYAVFEFVDNDVVIEQSVIERGIDNIYSELMDVVDEKIGNNFKDYAVDKSVIQITPFQYAVCVTDKNKNVITYDNYGDELTEYTNEDETSYSEGSSIYIYSNNWKSSSYTEEKSSKIVLKKFTKRSTLFSEDKIENITGKYACAVQALTQIAYMEGLCTGTSKSIQTTYNLLWDYTDTKETDDSKKKTSKDKIIYGTTGTWITPGIQKSAKGFVEYAQEMGYTDTKYKGVESNPSVAWIKDKLKNNRPVLMSYAINVKGEDDNTGHQISILGYIKAKKVSSGNTWNYLMVYDGWHSTVSYLNYSTVDFTRCDATYFWVK